MKVVAIADRKGDGSKTTMAINLGVVLPEGGAAFYSLPLIPRGYGVPLRANFEVPEDLCVFSEFLS
jgi:hypothetical protein